MDCLVLHGVTKRFGHVLAASDVSLNATSGRIFGLLGPNGAGKTTTLRIITSIFSPDEGYVTLDDREIGTWSQPLIGYLPEERGLYQKSKVSDQLRYLSQLKGVSKSDSAENIRYWLNRLGLEKWGNRKVRDLSKGMQQKVQFIATILAHPQLIILDEPFSGLDPLNSELLCEIISELKHDGRILLLASHRMEQVEKLCDDIGIIAQGKLVLSGNLREIKQTFKRDKLSLEYTGEASFLDDMEKVGEIQYLERNEDGCILKLLNDCDPRAILEKLMLVPDLELLQFDLFQPTLNEIFINVVGDQ